MPSRSSKNTQLLVVGLVAAATISLAIYFASTPATAKSIVDDDEEKKKKSKKLETPASKSSNSSSSSTDSTHAFVGGIVHLDDTPKRSNVTDEKELHSKIEELDKKGKALFKVKQVCHVGLVIVLHPIPLYHVMLCCAVLYNLFKIRDFKFNSYFFVRQFLA
mmetsp:Transcript_10326/g.21919  ORF Transcript_10326/g.21919 Transcript_10326/m.21919 type:complete len:162 (+) Transcript_10326:166-651(+)